MGSQIIKQANGKYALFSSVVDCFTVTDATEQELIDYFADQERERIKERVHNIVEMLERGEKPYFQFTLTWAEAEAEDAKSRRAHPEDKHGR